MPAHILIVEDSALVTEALRLLLEESGFRVTVAEDVAGAVAVCEAETPDVVLLDLTLPDGDGLEVLQRLRDGQRPRVAIALTGHDDSAVRQRCLDAGCRDVLIKPVPIRALLASVREWSAA